MTKLGKVLIVDDDPVGRFIAGKTLQQSGATTAIFEAEDGRQALELVGREPFDLILLDINMPVMDGFQFLDHLNLLQKGTGMVVPAIIMLSTSDHTEDKARMAAYTVVKGHLTKPFASSLVHRLLDLLEDRE